MTTTTTSTPGGYTSRFVAHVVHSQTTAHDKATSNSSNPLDRDRFRAFNADGYSAGARVVADKVIATATTATFADLAFDGDADDENALKPQSYANSASRTDVITDTDKSTTSSTSLHHLAISKPSESLLEDGRDDVRVARANSGMAPFEDEAAFAETCSGNDGISSVADHGSAHVIDDDTSVTGYDEIAAGNYASESTPAVFRVVVEDVDGTADAGQVVSEFANRSVAAIDGRRDRSRSKDSQTISECSSSISGQTVSDSESASDSKSEDEDEDGEDDESRDENCNVKKRKEGKKNDKDLDHEDGAGSDVNEENESSESDEEATILSAGSNTRGENSATPNDRYEEEPKRRSVSIIDERSIEEMFDDNGWVITEQDLQQDLQSDLQTTSANLPNVRSTSDSADRPFELSEGSAVDTSSRYDREDAAVTRSEEIIPRKSRDRDETTGNLEGSSAQSTSIDDDIERTILTSERRTSENPLRSRVYRQSSLGKNGWLVSDESESETERTISPIEASCDRDGDAENRSARAIEDSMMGSIDENGWVILNGDRNDRVADRSAQESIRSTQTTDHVAKSNIENGGLVANANRSKATEQSEPGEYEETPGTDISIPMQMVTTVFCVSVLCYSVLTNLFL